ncbi:MAG TPA: hypothetical protein EYG11_20405, partial [Candidatus Latescibacteria bacterium]|nr:hypothetical protein [Candidatus Latescibacterota bacterium]
MGTALDYGVQSFCFRHFKDNAEVAKKVKAIGVNTIEVCAVHADFNDPQGWKDIVKTYQDAEVGIVSIGVQTFTGLDSDRDFFACAAIAGAKHISCHFKIDSYTKAIPMVRAW